MHTVWRVLRAVLGLAGLVGTVLCLAGIVGCWVLYAEAVRRTDRALGRVTDALTAHHANLVRARDQLVRTRGELNDLRERDAEVNVPERNARRSKLRQTSAGATAKLADARRVVVGATEAALVAEGFLSALAELPVADRVGVDVEALRDAADRLSDAAQTTERLSGLLGPAAPEPSGTAVREHSARLDELLGAVAGAVGAGAERLENARERTERLRAPLVRAFTGAALLGTFLLAWIGAGQASLLRRGLFRS